MLKLRERRLNRHIDNQKGQVGEGETSVFTSRPRPSAREPQGIPGRTSSVDTDESASGEAGSEEVDTNPLADAAWWSYSIRTAGRGTAGTGNSGIRGALTLRVPRLNFSSHLSRTVMDYNIQDDPLMNHHEDFVAEELCDNKVEYCRSSAAAKLRTENIETVKELAAVDSNSALALESKHSNNQSYLHLKSPLTLSHSPVDPTHIHQASKLLPPLPHIFASPNDLQNILSRHSLSAPSGHLRKFHGVSPFDSTNSFGDLGNFLPPAYDFSDTCRDTSNSIADSEPTHMFLDPHSPIHSPSVSSSLEEPTHIPLSSLSTNKHSWTAAFSRPSPFTFRETSQATPPTPSYREKFGLDLKRPRVTRSISHNSSHNTVNNSESLPHLGHNISLPIYRGRSASDTSPLLTHSSSSSPNALYGFINDDDDDAFFAEAPSCPYPYSQTPFHPIITRNSEDYNATCHISPYHTSATLKLTVNNGTPPLPSPRLSEGKNKTYNKSAKPDSQNNKLEPTSPVPPLIPIDQIRSCQDNIQSFPPKQLKGTKAATTVFFKFPCLTTSSSSNEATSPTTAAAHLPSAIDNNEAKSPTEYSSGSEVSPLMFTSFSNASSASYEDLRQFALDRQKNCQEIETLLKLFPNQVTVDECVKALECTHWDVNKASKYLQLKRLFSLGLADVHRCKQILAACGWNLQQAAESLLESCKTSASSETPFPSRTGICHIPVPEASGSASPESLDV
ncbi:hypothetical protein Btru_008581 [Bulinus truncatus]|nr:hypothetical protein Btru_008581 [Bulinus truncatus]